MKTKQHLLFAALLLSCVTAGSLASHSFNSAENYNIANSRTILKSNADAEIPTPGEFFDDVECSISKINYGVSSATISLTFKMNDVSDSNEYALTRISGYDDDGKPIIAPAILEYKVKVKGANEGTTFYTQINKVREKLPYDIVGNKNASVEGESDVNRLGTKFTTKVEIKNFNVRTDKIDVDSGFKVHNLYKFSSKENNLLKTGEEYKSYSITATKSSTFEQIALEEFLTSTYVGRSNFAGIGSLNYQIKPEFVGKDYRIEKYENELAEKKQDLSEAREIYNNLNAIKKDYEKNYSKEELKTNEDYQKVVKDARLAKINANSYNNSINTLNINIENTKSGYFRVDTMFSISGNEKITVLYKDGTSAEIVTESPIFINFSNGESNFSLFDKCLIGKEILGVEISKCSIDVKTFCPRKDGKKGGYYDSQLSLKHLFNNVLFATENFEYTDANGNKVILKNSVDNPYNNNNDIILGATVGSFIAIYELVSIITYFYLKKKYEHDIFRRVRTKQYFTTNTMGLVATTSLLTAIIAIVMRTTSLNNTLVVSNPIDIIIVVFSVLAIIFCGYFIKYFAVQIKNIREKKRNDKLNNSKKVSDDGTIAPASSK